LKAYNPYEKYGLRRVINAATCLTRLGGSRPHPDVFKAMEDASRAYIQIPALQAWAGEKIAEATGAEAGLPTAGAVNALTLAAAACMMKGTELERYDPLGQRPPTHMIQRLPMHTEGLRTEFVVQKSDRNTYDHAVECAGGRMVEAGTDQRTTAEELEVAFTDRTAAFYFTVRGSKKGLPLDACIEIAHGNGVPVIVDAAPDLRPKKILTHYIEKGVDLVVFSGGKHLGGPNNTGILAGRRDLVKLAHLQAYPFDGIGRGAKMSRETIVGLVVALEKYQEKDDGALFEVWDEKARWMVGQLTGIPGLSAGVTCEYTVEEGEPMTPLAYVTLDEEEAGMSAVELQARLKEGDPIIETLHEPAFLIDDYEGKLTINPEHMLEGDEEIVVRRIREILLGS
jgi:D-glucosaminate-6-phosphate ammonia-lyase